MGKKVQFHRKVEKSIQKAKRIKPFHRRIDNQKYLFMKLKQFRMRELDRRKVQANKSIR